MLGRGTNSTCTSTQRGLARFEGVFTNRSENSIGQLTSSDGTAYTAGFAEGTGGSHKYDATPPPPATQPMEFAASWMGFASLPTAGGMAQHGNTSFWYHLSSTHAGVVNMAMMDGSVKSVRIGGTRATLLPLQLPEPEPANFSASSDYWVLQELCGKSDQGLRPQNSIVP